MAVRLIGTAVTARAMCPECLSILEYDPPDRRWVGGKNDKRKPGTMSVVRIPYTVLDCPVCKNEIRL